MGIDRALCFQIPRPTGEEVGGRGGGGVDSATRGPSWRPETRITCAAESRLDLSQPLHKLKSELLTSHFPYAMSVCNVIAVRFEKYAVSTFSNTPIFRDFILAIACLSTKEPFLFFPKLRPAITLDSCPRALWTPVNHLNQ